MRYERDAEFFGKRLLLHSLGVLLGRRQKALGFPGKAFLGSTMLGDASILPATGLTGNYSLQS